MRLIRYILILIGVAFMLALPFALSGCACGNREVVIDGVTYSVEYKTVIGLPYHKVTVRKLSTEEKEEAREDAEVEFQIKLQQEIDKQELRRVQFITVLICICLAIAVAFTVAAIFFKGTGSWATGAYAFYVCSGVLAIWSNILSWAHSGWMAAALVALGVVFFLARRVDVLGSATSKVKAWFNREDEDE